MAEETKVKAIARASATGPGKPAWVFSVPSIGRSKTSITLEKDTDDTMSKANDNKREKA